MLTLELSQSNIVMAQFMLTRLKDKIVDDFFKIISIKTIIYNSKS